MAEERKPAHNAAEKPPLPTVRVTAAETRVNTEAPKNVWGDSANRTVADERSSKRLSWFNRKGETLGPYRLGKTLGAGGIGTVRKARHMSTNRRVAIKCVVMDEKKIKFIKREIAISRLLFHPNIVRLHDVIYEDFNKEVHMVMDLVDGVALLDYIISHGQMKERGARPFFRQIVSAVEYCHRNCIVHRDLKIENILIDKRGLVRLIDFGLSSMYNPKEYLRTNCGSVYFAAPELLVKAPYHGPEVDIWALGVILYVMLMGRVPFEAPNLPKLYEKIRQGDVRFPPQIPLSDSAKQLIRSMLTVDRTKRATLEEVLNHPWVCDGYSGPPRCQFPERAPIKDINPSVVAKMQEFDFAPEAVQDVLGKAVAGVYGPNELEPILQVYYLVLEKMERDKLSEVERRQSLSRLLRSTLQLVDGSSQFSDISFEDDDVPAGRGKDAATAAEHARDAVPGIVVSSDGTVVAEASAPALSQPPVTPPKRRGRSATTSSRQQPVIEPLATIAEVSESPRTPPVSFPAPDTAAATAPVGQGQQLLTVPGAAAQGTTGGSSATPKRGRQRSSTISAVKNAMQSLTLYNKGSSSGSASPPSGGTLNSSSSSSSKSRQSVVSRSTDLHGSTTLAPGPVTSPSSSSTINSQDRNTPKLVEHKAFFSVATTSTKPPYLIKDEIMRVLDNLHIAYQDNGFTLTCLHTPSAALESPVLEGTPASNALQDVHFSLSVVKVALLNMHGIVLKRYAGDAIVYKNLCQMILSELKL